MRDTALFPLAHVCHLSPTEVDELSFQDFLVLSSTAKMWMERGGTP